MCIGVFLHRTVKVTYEDAASSAERATTIIPDMLRVERRAEPAGFSLLPETNINLTNINPLALRRQDSTSPCMHACVRVRVCVFLSLGEVLHSQTFFGN